VAWTTPLTAVSNATLTAAQWNASVRDNLLETAPAKATAAGRIFVSTGANALAERVIDSTVTSSSSTTTSTSYGSLVAGAGPVVTATTGTRALVFASATVSNGTLGQKSWIAPAVSGASTIAAADTDSMEFQVYGSNAEFRGSAAILYKTLTGGSNTFTLQYRVSGGTATFFDRAITVIAL